MSEIPKKCIRIDIRREFGFHFLIHTPEIVDFVTRYCYYLTNYELMSHKIHCDRISISSRSNRNDAFVWRKAPRTKTGYVQYFDGKLSVVTEWRDGSRVSLDAAVEGA